MSGQSPKKSNDDELLDQIWTRMSGLFVEKRDAFFTLLRQHQLTPPHGFALTMLADGPIRMRELADQMNCDASYITAIVDRLEDADLVERRPSSTDRRVKDVALTDIGRKTAASLTKAMTAPPVILKRLSRSDRSALLRILTTIVADEPHNLNPFGPVHRP